MWVFENDWINPMSLDKKTHTESGTSQRTQLILSDAHEVHIFANDDDTLHSSIRGGMIPCTPLFEDRAVVHESFVICEKLNFCGIACHDDDEYSPACKQRLSLCTREIFPNTCIGNHLHVGLRDKYLHYQTKRLKYINMLTAITICIIWFMPI